MSQARRKDGRPLGKIMGDAVRESANSLLLVGGFIILFSVVVRILGTQAASQAPAPLWQGDGNPYQGSVWMRVLPGS